MNGLEARDQLLGQAIFCQVAAGAGFQLALACDLRVCGDDARFAMRETSLGLVPDLTGTHPLVSTVGYSRALELCATGRWVPSDEALALGIATLVVPGPDLEVATHTLVAALLAAPEEALRATKGVLLAAATSSPEDSRAFERSAQVPLLRRLAASVRP